MSKNFITSAIFFTSLIQMVLGHGFLYSPRPRGYKEISYAIDNLRNPTNQGNQCRGKSPDGTVTSIRIVPGGQFKVQLALSIGAEHIGHCSLELYSEDGTKKIVLASNVNGCASENGFKQKSPGASSQCPGQLPESLVTDDMCLKDWSVQIPSSLSGLDFNKGYLRWTWAAQHVSPNEFYVSCADVTIEDAGNSSSDSGKDETSPSSPTSSPSKQSSSTSPPSSNAKYSQVSSSSDKKPSPPPSSNYKSSLSSSPKKKNKKKYKNCKDD